MFAINEKVTSRNAVNASEKAFDIAHRYGDGKSKEVVYLMTAYITLLCDIKKVQVNNEHLDSLARQVQYITDNRFKGDFSKTEEVLKSFSDYFDIKAFEKAQSKPTPKADFIAFLNTHKNVQLATALAKGKEYGLTDTETLESINLWTAGQAVNA